MSVASAFLLQLDENIKLIVAPRRVVSGGSAGSVLAAAWQYRRRHPCRWLSTPKPAYGIVNAS